MATLGFDTYVIPEPTPPPTIAEILAALTVSQRADILDGYGKKVLPKDFKYVYGGTIPREAVYTLYVGIDDVKETSRLLMREEVVITEGTYDPETGEEITPPVYNTAPADAAELIADLEPNFVDVFNTSQITAVVNDMISYSELNAAGAPIGTWTVYESGVTA